MSVCGLQSAICVLSKVCSRSTSTQPAGGEGIGVGCVYKSQQGVKLLTLPKRWNAFRGEEADMRGALACNLRGHHDEDYDRAMLSLGSSAHLHPGVLVSWGEMFWRVIV